KPVSASWRAIVRPRRLPPMGRGGHGGAAMASHSPSRQAQRNERAARKEIKTLEQTIAQLDEQKRVLNAQLLKSTDATEALRLHNEVSALTTQLTEAEERW